MMMRIYLLLIAYAPRWVIRLIPIRWRHKQLRRIMFKDAGR